MKDAKGEGLIKRRIRDFLVVELACKKRVEARHVNHVSKIGLEVPFSVNADKFISI